MHIIDIDIDDNLNPRAFRVQDNSVYDEALDAKNLILEIKSPGSVFNLPFRVNKGFSKVFNASLLKINSGGNSPLPSLPDGLYEIRFSVAPNIQVYEEYYYFRNVKQMNKYLSLLTELLRSRININKESYNKRKEELLWIHQLIKASKYTAEDVHDITLALEEYKTIDELILKYEGK